MSTFGRRVWTAMIACLLTLDLTTLQTVAQTPVPPATLPAGANVPAGPASEATAGGLQGSIVDERQIAIGGAQIRLSGRRSAVATSDAAGHFRFAAVPPGLYTLFISKPGFSSVSRDDVTILAGQPTLATILLPAASFSSLREIGRVSGSRAGGGSINTSSASIATLSAQTFIDQGQLQLPAVLSEIPGVTTSYTNYDAQVTTANPGNAFGVPSIRGALPYENSVLIDGHPIVVGSTGTYNLAYLSPYVLQSVEVVKGPGSAVPVINNAIGGTLNLRTLEPTAKSQRSIDYGLDNEVGSFINLQATGTAGKIGYALNYNSTGSPGAYRNHAEPVAPLYATTINGQPIVTSPFTQVAGNPAIYQSNSNVATLAGCCVPVNSDFQLRSELAKVRVNFSEQTSVTLSYLGSQTQTDLNGLENYAYPTTFSSASAAVGPFTSGQDVSCCQNDQFPQFLDRNSSNLWQAEVRSALGTNTLLFQGFSGSVHDLLFDGGENGTTTYSVPLYGSVLLGDAPGTLTNFNGQTATVTAPGTLYTYDRMDKVGGYSFELDHPVHESIFSLAYNASKTASYFGGIAGFGNALYVPSGSSQTESTLQGRAQLALTPRINATLSDYYFLYTNHSTQDSGLTFADHTHAFEGARLGLTWQPDRNTSLRFGAGSSIAPPYLQLVSTAQAPPVPNNNGLPTYWTVTQNSPDIKPETGFGYDLGADKRFGHGITASADVYLTNLHNQFLQTETLTGSYTGLCCGLPAALNLPLYGVASTNLGTSRYEGLELSVRRDPQRGLGFALDGALIRAYVYNLPAGFYDTVSGAFTQNLGVIPNVNFQPTGLGYNGMLFGRVPYAQGYGELNYRTGGVFYRLGLTYYGNNNSYSVPAFVVLGATVRARLSSRTTLQLSGENLGGAHANGYLANCVGGVPVPLANHLLGATESYSYGPETVRLKFQYATGSTH